MERGERQRQMLEIIAAKSLVSRSRATAEIRGKSETLEMKTTFQSIPLSVFTNFFQPCTAIPLDCDGIAQLLTTILTLSEIPHQGYIGQVQCPNHDVVMPHCWIELVSDQGTLFRVDYELKDWISIEIKSSVPIEFFVPEDYPEYRYQGNPIQHLVWTAEPFDFIPSWSRSHYAATALPRSAIRSKFHEADHCNSRLPVEHFLCLNIFQLPISNLLLRSEQLCDRFE